MAHEKDMNIKFVASKWELSYRFSYELAMPISTDPTTYAYEEKSE